MIQRVKDLLQRAISSRVIRDSSAMSIASWISTALGMLTSFVLAILIGDTGYGLITVGIALVSTVAQFLDIRTSEGIVKFVGNALARDEDAEAITFFYVGLIADTVLMLATVAAVLLIAPLSAAVYGEDSEVIRQLVRIYALTIPFATLEGTFESMVTVFKRFNLYAGIRIANSVVLITSLIVGAQFGVVGVMWGYVAASAFSFFAWFIGGLMHLRRRISTLRGRDFRAAWKQFLPFSFHTSVTASLKAIAGNIDVLVLGALVSPEVAGYFRLARSASNLIMLPTLQASAVIYPEMIEAWAEKNVKRVRMLVWQYTRISFLINSAVYVFFLIAADWLVMLFYGPDFSPVGNLIRLLGIGTILESVFRWVRPATMAAGKPQLATAYNVASMVLRILIVVPFVYWLGATGSALAYDLVALVTVLIMVFYALPRLGMHLGVKGITAIGPESE